MKSILEMTDQEILGLKMEDCMRRLSIEEIVHIFVSLQAFFLNPGDYSKPHVRLTAGGHSNGYINCPQVLQHDNLRRILAYQIFRLIKEDPATANLAYSDWVVGSDTSATKLAGDVAYICCCKHGVMKKRENKEQIWQGRMSFDQVIPERIKPGERVLHLEELMTTAFTAENLRQGIKAAHPSQEIAFFPVIPVLMHRSPVYEVAGAKVAALYHFEISNWSEEECLYCKHGSPLVENPKQNWALLTGQAS